jgi:hypothetical protein
VKKSMSMSGFAANPAPDLEDGRDQAEDREGETEPGGERVDIGAVLARPGGQRTDPEPGGVLSVAFAPRHGLDLAMAMAMAMAMARPRAAFGIPINLVTMGDLGRPAPIRHFKRPEHCHGLTANPSLRLRRCRA